MASFDPLRPDRTGYQADYERLLKAIARLESEVAALKNSKETGTIVPVSTRLPSASPGSFEGTHAGGDLRGSYPDPIIATGAVTSDKILDGTITDTDVATANKDGLAATPSLRTLGTGAAQAAAGNDARLSDTRTPTNGSVTTAKMDPTLLNGTAALAPLTIAGTTGSVTYVNGVATAYVAPT